MSCFVSVKNSSQGLKKSKSGKKETDCINVEDGMEVQYCRINFSKRILHAKFSKSVPK